MKNNIILLLAFFSFFAYGQQKYYTLSGELIFESSVETFEEIKGVNNKVTAILNTEGAIAALALVKGFRFKIALMEEHFNENYLESEEYPKATFSGNIIGFSMDKITETNSQHIIKGKLTIKEISKEITITSFIKQVEGLIYLSSNFSAKPEDFGIKIPNIVSSKIAKEVSISLNLALKLK
jgi:hypothetical protein